MKKIIIILIFFICAGAVLANSQTRPQSQTHPMPPIPPNPPISSQPQRYNVYKPNEFPSKIFDTPDEKLLFILDFSESMTEEIDGEKKVDLMLRTMSQILPTINKNIAVGLRVYGNRIGFTQYDSCKASSLLVPVSPDSAGLIQAKLAKTKPRGMTPITYSLKKATDLDFNGFQGKKHIILLTDGGENCDESPCVWAMDLITKRKDVKIDVIAFNVDGQDDIDQLQCTALVTTGKFYTANTAADLANSLKNSLNIKKQVDAKIIMNP